MKRLIAILGTTLLAASLAVQADTVLVQPGSDLQTTPIGTFFPNDLTVRVLDDQGAPVVGTQVNFINMDGKAFFGVGTQFSGHEAAVTDTTGTAVAPGLIGFQTGDGVVDIYTVGNQSNATHVHFTVVATGALRSFVAVSGGGQKAYVNTPYAAPWVAQAFDANGNVVPRAASLFFAEQDQTMPSVLFNGQPTVWVRADSNGIAVSPTFSANSVNGHDEGGVMGYSSVSPVGSAFFAYTNLSAGGGGSGGTGDGCGRQGKGNGNCGNSPANSSGNGNNGNGKG